MQLQQPLLNTRDNATSTVTIDNDVVGDEPDVSDDSGDIERMLLSDVPREIPKTDTDYDARTDEAARDPSFIVRTLKRPLTILLITFLLLATVLVFAAPAFSFWSNPAWVWALLAAGHVVLAMLCMLIEYGVVFGLNRLGYHAGAPFKSLLGTAIFVLVIQLAWKLALMVSTTKVGALVDTTLLCIQIVVTTLMVRRALHQSIVYGWRKQRFSEQALAIVSLGRVLQRMCCSDDKDIDVVRSQLPPVATFVQQWQSLLRPLTLPMRYVRSSDSKTAVFDLNSAAVFTSPTDQPELARALFDNFVRSTAVAAPQTPKGVAGIAGWQRLFRDRKLALSAFDAMFAKYVQFDRRRPITFRLFRDALDNYMLRRDQLVSSISTFDDLTQVIDGVASFAFWLIMLYIVVTLYGGSGGELLTSLSAFLISFAFAFGTPISQTVVSIMYIFIQKPFDVGDRLRIDKDEFIVQKMNLLTTTLRSDDNSLRVVVNQQLANSPLTNLSRTSSAIVIVSVQVPIEMSAAAMRDFRTQLSNFLSMNEDQWFPVLHIFVVDCTGDKGPLSLTVRAQLRLGWDDAQQALLCRSRFVDSIRRALLANTGSKVVINPEDEEKDA